MAWGCSDAYSYSEVLQFVINDLDKEELKLFRSGKSEAIAGLKIAKEVIRKHQKIGYG